MIYMLYTILILLSVLLLYLYFIFHFFSCKPFSLVHRVEGVSSKLSVKRVKESLFSEEFVRFFF